MATHSLLLDLIEAPEPLHEDLAWHDLRRVLAVVVARSPCKFIADGDRDRVKTALQRYFNPGSAPLHIFFPAPLLLKVAKVDLDLAQFILRPDGLGYKWDKMHAEVYKRLFTEHLPLLTMAYEVQPGWVCTRVGILAEACILSRQHASLAQLMAYVRVTEEVSVLLDAVAVALTVQDDTALKTMLDCAKVYPNWTKRMTEQLRMLVQTTAAMLNCAVPKNIVLH
jgi:hypothetical protein